jgi:cell shape-determining protein MreC
VPLTLSRELQEQVEQLEDENQQLREAYFAVTSHHQEPPSPHGGEGGGEGGDS